MRAVLSIVLMIGLVVFTPFVVGAADAGLWNACDLHNDMADSTICKNTDAEADTFIESLMNVLIWVVGVLAVIMIIFGGIKYALSAGDSAKLTAAKNTIMYSVIGLVIAIFAYTVVVYIIKHLTKQP